MAITQIAFKIPPEIQAGIDAGALLRFGGVVRDRAGHIVKHLEEVSMPEADNSAGENTVVQFAKKNKYFIIIQTIYVFLFPVYLYPKYDTLCPQNHWITPSVFL